MLTGSERPDSGDIWIGETRLEGDEATLTRRAAELGVRAVYQELSLVEGLTVAENLCLGQWPRRNGMIDYLQWRRTPNVACRRWALTLVLNNLFQH